MFLKQKFLLLFLDYKYLRWLSEIISYHLNKETLSYPLDYSDTNPDGQIQKAKWAKGLCDLLGERPA